MSNTTKGVKLLNKDLTAHKDFQYTIGEWAEATGEGGLCSEGMLHFYLHPLMAELMNQIHGSYPADAVMYEIEAQGEIESDRGLKYGAKRLRLVRKIQRPTITLAQRVAFAKGCAEWAAEAAKGPRLQADVIHAKLVEIAEKACK
jgi:hypothetical protein